MNDHTKNRKMAIQIDIAFDEGIVADEVELASLVEKAVNQAIVTAKLDLPGNPELSVLISGDEKLRELNRIWREKDKPTNVLSFPSDALVPGEGMVTPVGDIAISLETTRSESDLEKKAFNDHFSHLIVHGFLHLFGYDHENDTEADLMESLEIRVLAGLGIENPY